MMYCSQCGKPIDNNSKYCQNCGAAINKSHEIHGESNPKEVTHKASESIEKSPGLTGWLALLGIGLFINIFLYGKSALDTLPLLSNTFEIPGYSTLLLFEMVASALFGTAAAYLLYLFLKKNERFPGYCFIFLMSVIVYVIFDYMFLALLDAPSVELKQVIDSTLSSNIGTVGRTIIVSMVWALYIKKSHQVKATFINK